jgi:hypothetical protein
MTVWQRGHFMEAGVEVSISRTLEVGPATALA